MDVSDRLADTRVSYDTVVASYADLLRDALAEEPVPRAPSGPGVSRAGSSSPTGDGGTVPWCLPPR
ncbi:hypothetical protein [Micromonospora sp. NPDC051141]|uniref:hypothetical protein n=1 Tax=Micromonospora sp. NPDC051141 TaxID=3364284 RepID=UPI0037A88760